MKPGLSALIQPRTSEEFFSKYESNEFFVVHNTQLKALAELPFLSSLQSLLRSWPFAIQAYLPDLRDESSSIDTNPKDAQKLFNNGMGLLFNEAQNISGVLKNWLEILRKDLGLSAQTYSRCLIYATPDGKGTAPHFDQNINFVLQISGTKTWHLAPNLHLQNPLTRFTMGSTPDSEMQSYLQVPMPDKMPAGAESLALNPGSLLFVPRGYWHSTEASGDALALNFTFTAPTWIDLFTTALRSRLALSPEWRETANGVGDPGLRDMAEANLESLLAQVVEDIPNWRAEDILNSTEPMEII